MIPSLLAATLTFFAFLVGHVVLFNLFIIERRFQALVATWLILLALYAGLYCIFQQHLPLAWQSTAPLLSIVGIVALLNGVVIYLLLFLIYCCFYFVDHSLTVAFAIEFDLRGSMTIEDLKKRFPYDVMLAQRLEDLIANHYVTREGDAYRLAHKGLCFVAVLGSVKRFLRLEPGG